MTARAGFSDKIIHRMMRRQCHLVGFLLLLVSFLVAAADLPSLIADLGSTAAPSQREAAMKQLKKLGSGATAALVEALGNPDWRVRNNSADLLGEVRDQSALPGMVAALTSGNWASREAAGRAFERFGPGAVEALVPLAKDEKTEVAQAAILALGRIGDRRAAPAISPILEDLNHPLWRFAAEAAGRIGAAELSPLLKQAENHPQLGPIAVTALARLRAETKESELARILEEEGRVPPTITAEAIGRAGPRVIPALHKILLADLAGNTTSPHDAIIRGLGEIGSPDGAEAMLDVARSTEPAWRVTGLLAVEMLGRLSGKPPLKALTQLLQDPRTEFRIAAIRALAIRSDSKARKAVEPLTKEPDPLIRQEAEGALRWIDTAKQRQKK